MSLRIDTNDLIAGAYVVGETGLGVLAENIPSTGTHGASYLYNDLSLPADNGKEIRGLVETPPASGTFFAYEDGSFSYTGPNGVHTFTYRLFADGVDLGTTTGTITVGAAVAGVLTGGVTLGDVSAEGAMGAGGQSDLSGSADLGGITASGVAATEGQDPGEPTLIASELRRYWSARARNVFRGDRGMYNYPLGPKDPSEIKTILFDFARELGDSTIASVVEATPTTYRGTDLSPADVKVAGPVIDGTTVLVRMGGGVDGAAYKWLIRVQDSAGNVHAMTDWVLVRSL